MGMMGNNPYYAPNPWAEAINGFRSGYQDRRQRNIVDQEMAMRQQEADQARQFNALKMQQAQDEQTRMEQFQNDIAPRLPNAPTTSFDGGQFNMQGDPGGPRSIEEIKSAYMRRYPKQGAEMMFGQENQDSKLQSAMELMAEKQRLALEALKEEYKNKKDLKSTPAIVINQGGGKGSEKAAKADRVIYVDQVNGARHAIDLNNPIHVAWLAKYGKQLVPEKTYDTQKKEPASPLTPSGKLTYNPKTGKFE